MNCSKSNKFDNENLAVNPNVYKHELSLPNREDKIILVLKIAKAKTGFVYGYDMKCNGLFGELRHDVPCFYYSLSYMSLKRAILAALIDLTKFLSLEVCPIPLITMVGNLFVHYCQKDFSDHVKIG